MWTEREELTDVPETVPLHRRPARPAPELDWLPSSAPAQENKPDAEDSFSVIELFTIFARRKWFLVRATLGTAILIGGYSFTLPADYTATTSLLPPQGAGSSSAALLSQMGGLGSLGGLGAASLGLKSPIDQDIYLMRTQIVEDAVIHRFDLQQQFHTKFLSDARKKLNLIIQIQPDTKAGVIELSAHNGNPDRAAELANGYVEEYRKLSSTLAVTEAAQRRLFFEGQLETEKNKLAQAEEDLKRTEQTTGMVEMDGQARALIQSVGSLRAQIAAKEVQISSMRTYAADGNVDLMEAQQELASLRAQLAKLGGENSGSDMLFSKARLPEAGLEYVRKYREVKYHETLFETLARQNELAKLDEAKEGGIIQVIEPAIPPDRRSSPTHFLWVLGGAFTGLFLGSIAIGLRAGFAGDGAAGIRASALRKALLQWSDS